MELTKDEQLKLIQADQMRIDEAIEHAKKQIDGWNAIIGGLKAERKGNIVRLLNLKARYKVGDFTNIRATGRGRIAVQVTDVWLNDYDEVVYRFKDSNNQKINPERVLEIL